MHLRPTKAPSRLSYCTTSFLSIFRTYVCIRRVQVHTQNSDQRFIGDGMSAGRLYSYIYVQYAVGMDVVVGETIMQLQLLFILHIRVLYTAYYVVDVCEWCSIEGIQKLLLVFYWSDRSFGLIHSYSNQICHKWCRFEIMRVRKSK